MASTPAAWANVVSALAIAVAIASGLSILHGARHVVSASLASARARACLVYCSGDLLDAVQTLMLFNDSKTFVDMPMRADPEEITRKFAALRRPLTKEILSDFVGRYFYEAGSDVLTHVPEDWVPKPPLVIRLGSEEAKNWVMDLMDKWRVLGRKTADSVAKYPQRTSTLFREHPFVVPGGRFRESYYWDTYWIVKGLLECSMTLTATNVVQNLLNDVTTFGFVPNGGRVYYVTRTQPPLLAPMVADVYEATSDTDFLASAVQVLDKEYQFWMDETNLRVVSVPAPAGDSSVITGDSKIQPKVYTLNRYYSKDDTPRPESYREDLETRAAGGDCREIRSAAESGWDFSSRWMESDSKTKTGSARDWNLTEIRITNVIPVDLNSFMYKMEDTLSRLHGELGNAQASQRYAQAAARRREAILKVLRKSGSTDESRGFADLWIDSNTPSPCGAAGFAPAWAGVLDTWDADKKDKFIAEEFSKSPLNLPGGLATTKVSSGQQWDMPNAWPPLQSILIEGMRRLDTEKSKEIAKALAEQWLATNYKAWVPKKNMYEKYNAQRCGEGGGGGEYEVQVGFGWSNGVVLHLLGQYPNLSFVGQCT